MIKLIYKKINNNILFLLLLTAYFIVRVSFLLGPIWLNHDSSMVAIMARNMIQNFRFEPFFYGAGYSGILETFFSAIFFLLFGINEYSLILSTIIISTINIIVCYKIAKYLFNKKTAILTSILLIYSPHEVMTLSYYPRVVYALTPLFSMLIILYSIKIIKNKHILHYIILGFISGVGLWNHGLIIYAIVTSLIFILISNYRIIFNKKIIISIISFIIGFIPYIYFKIQTGFVKVNVINYIPHVSYIKGLYNIFIISIPKLFFIPFKYSNINYVKIFVYIYGAIFLIAFLLSFKKINKKNLILPLMILITILIFLLHPFRVYTHPRYIYILYFPSILMVASGFEYIYYKNKKICFIFLSIVILIGYYNYKTYKNNIFDKNSDTLNKFNKNILLPLKKLNQSVGYTDINYSRINSSCVDYYTNGNIQLAEIQNENNKKIQIKADSNENPFFITSKKYYVKNIKEGIKCNFSLENNRYYNILYNFKIDQILDNSLPLNSIKTNSKNNYLFDRNFTTRSNSIKCNDNYELNIIFNKNKNISRIIFLSENLVFPENSYFKIFVSKDNKTYNEIKSFKSLKPIFTSSHKLYFNYYKPIYEFHLFKDNIKSVKFISNKKFHFHECFIFKNSNIVNKNSCNINKIKNFIKNNKIQKVFIERHKSAKLINSNLPKNIKIVEPLNKSYWLPMPILPIFNPNKFKSLIVVDPGHENNFKMFLDVFEYKYKIKSIDNYTLFYNFSNHNNKIKILWTPYSLLTNSSISKNLKSLEKSIKIKNTKEKIKLLKNISPNHKLVHNISFAPEINFKNSIKVQINKINQQKQNIILKATLLILNKLEVNHFIFFHFKHKNNILFQDDILITSILENEYFFINKTIPIPKNVNIKDIEIHIGIWQPDIKKRLNITNTNFKTQNNQTVIIKLK